MFNMILVPLDGSALSERALQPALRLAKPSDSALLPIRNLILLHVTVPPAAGELGWLLPGEVVERSRREVDDYLDAVRKTLQLSGVPSSPRIVEGDEAGTIVDTATAEAADLIVMSSHGYSGIVRWMLGSVTERVLDSAPCPVMVVRSARPIRRILITLDGSSLAEQALPVGIEVASRLGADITLLQVTPTVSLTGQRSIQYNWSRPVEDGGAESGVSNAQASYLERIAVAHQPTGVDMSTVGLPGSAAGSILSYAEANDIDLIVMSTHGRTGLRRWLYGSVTAKVLRGAPCSMLIVRPPSEALRE